MTRAHGNGSTRAVIFRKQFLDGIREGRVTLAFRRWKRPSVRTGGTLLTAAGRLSILKVGPVDADQITPGDARKAGFESRDALFKELDKAGNGTLYRIDLGGLEADPRIALREQTADTVERAALGERLRRMDRRSATGAWTLGTLRAIRDNPGRVARDLCRVVGQERDPFKVNVRKLKAMGLTESLEVGYRISPRGRALLAWIESEATSDE